MTMDELGWRAGGLRAKQDDGGSGNPDPTMRHAKGSPKGENVPPLGGESISPVNSKQPSRPNDPDTASGPTRVDEDDPRPRKTPPTLARP